MRRRHRSEERTAPTEPVLPTSTEIDRAVDTLRDGGLVVFPTETVYGIGASVRRPDAVEALFAAKRRPAHQAMTVHLGADADLDRWALEVPPGARRLVAEHWPGPLTVVLTSRPEVPESVRGGGAGVGLRVPDHPVALDLLERFGDGLVGTSANLHGEPSPTTAAAALDATGSAATCVLDAGPCPVGIASTVVDLTVDPPRLLREGSLSLREVESLLGASPETPGR